MVDVSEPLPSSLHEIRGEARQRVQRRRNMQGGLVAYVVINAFLIGVWAMTGGGYFWPGWILAGWGVGMVLALWDYWRKPISEADIEEELRRMTWPS